MSDADEHVAKRTLPRGLLQLVIAAVATVTFIAIALRVIEHRADAFDRRWTLALHGIDTPTLDVVMFVFTTIGSGVCLYGLIALVSLVALREHRWPFAVLLLANATLTYVTNELLKHWFVRDRPRLFDEIAHPTSWSFPSGHAMSSMAVYGAIAAILIGLHPRLRWLFVTLATIVIAGVGISRVYLGVHWPSDVLAGWIAAIPIVIATVHVVHRIRRTPRAPGPPAPTPRS